MSKVLAFEKILSPLLEAYKQIVVKKNPDYQYSGPLLQTSYMLATSSNIDQALSYENLVYNEKEQDRAHIETLLRCAIQLGIEQGIHLCSEQPYIYLQTDSFDKLTQLLIEIKKTNDT